jgi:hypothetical protein
MSRRNRLFAAVAGIIMAAGTGLGLVASSASASTAFIPPPSACNYNLHGFNFLELTFQGNNFVYPMFVFRPATDGSFSGILVDTGLPTGHQVLHLNGRCVGNVVLLDTNYPTADPQGSRAEVMTITPDATYPYKGDVKGNWTETGPEQGNGTAELLRPVHHS